MEQNEPNKPTLGTWDRLPINDDPLPPKVSFELNVSQVVEFTSNDPEEREGDNGAYYTFPVVHNGNDTVIQTSAWTLLALLKKQTPLEGKTLKITKRMEKGRQFFTVEQVN